jgi:hypothetical protein
MMREAAAAATRCWPASRPTCAGARASRVTATVREIALTGDAHDWFQVAEHERCRWPTPARC